MIPLRGPLNIPQLDRDSKNKMNYSSPKAILEINLFKRKNIFG
jgi:hypothetical protein